MHLPRYKTKHNDKIQKINEYINGETGNGRKILGSDH